MARLPAVISRTTRILITRGATLLVGVVATAFAVNSALSADNSIAVRYDPTPPVAGVFIAWTGDDEIVVKDHDVETQFNTHTGKKVPTDYRAPTRRSLEETNNWLNQLRGDFPDSVLQRDPVTTKDVEWKSRWGGPVTSPRFVIAPNAQDPDRAEGEFAVYSAEGRSQSGEPSGSVGAHDALYALLYRKQGRFRLLPLEIAQHHLDGTNGEWGYAWPSLVSRVDPTDGKVLLYFERQPLESDVPWAAGWGPFNAWWFDPQSAKLEHVVLPDGPWVRDASSDGLLRAGACFSCGCGCYRGYELTVAGGLIFARITAEHGALSTATTGIYALIPSATSWQRIADATQSLGQIAPDGRKMAINKDGETRFIELVVR